MENWTIATTVFYNQWRRPCKNPTFFTPMKGWTWPVERRPSTDQNLISAQSTLTTRAKYPEGFFVVMVYLEDFSSSFSSYCPSGVFYERAPYPWIGRLSRIEKVGMWCQWKLIWIFKMAVFLNICNFSDWRSNVDVWQDNTTAQR